MDWLTDQNDTHLLNPDLVGGKGSYLKNSNIPRLGFLRLVFVRASGDISLCGVLSWCGWVAVCQWRW